MKRSEERNQFYSDIIVTAMAGGIYYWAADKHYNRVDEKNVSVRVRDMGDPDEPWTLIDNDAIGRALSMLKDGKVKTGRGQKFWAEVYRTMEGADIDADDADVIVQVACYGEIVFG